MPHRRQPGPPITPAGRILAEIFQLYNSGEHKLARQQFSIAFPTCPDDVRDHILSGAVSVVAEGTTISILQ